MSPLNTTLDYGWISYGEKVPCIQRILFGANFGIDKRITITIAIPITSTTTIAITVPAFKRL